MSAFLPAWHLDAACSNNPELDWFSETPTGVAAAKAVCAGCAVLSECRSDALARQDPWGVQAGLTAIERMAPLLLAEAEPVAHVASRGHYVQGCRLPECTALNTAYVADLRARAVVTTPSRVDAGEQLEIGMEAA